MGAVRENVVAVGRSSISASLGIRQVGEISFFLNLLSTPVVVAFAHVRRGLDRGDKFQRDVANTHEPNDRAGNDAEDVVFEEDGPDEDVD